MVILLARQFSVLGRSGLQPLTLALAIYIAIYIGAYCTIFNFSTKPNTFFKPINFPLVKSLTPGQPLSHALTAGARTHRWRTHFRSLARSLCSLAHPPHPPSRPEKARLLYCLLYIVTVVNSSKKPI